MDVYWYYVCYVNVKSSYAVENYFVDKEATSLKEGADRMIFPLN